MKTTFQTPEEIEALENLLRLGKSRTDLIFDKKFRESVPLDFIKYLICFRKKIFELLEEKDPRITFVKHLLKWIKEGNRYTIC